MHLYSNKLNIFSKNGYEVKNHIYFCKSKPLREHVQRMQFYENKFQINLCI